MSNGRVLVIEDNPLNLELVSGVLESLGCEIVGASTAEAGLRAVATAAPDVILLDMRLPGVSGYDAMALIRAHPGLAGTPVIAVTAQAMHGDAAAALQAGFEAYVSKPIDTHRLRDLVRSHLPRPAE